MEARGRNSGFGFPGYDGCFPKATRSSRGRGDSVRKSNEANDVPKDMCFFELLATVAGQLLQEQEEEALTGRSPADLEVPKVNVGRVVERGIACMDTNEISSCHLSVHNKALKKAVSKNEEKLSDVMTVDGDLEIHKHIMEKIEVLHEPSAISCLDYPDPLVPEHESKASMRPVKAYSSRKRNNSGASSCTNMASIRMPIKTEPGETLTSRPDQFSAKVKGEKSSDMLGCYSIDPRETNIVDKEDGDLNRKCIPNVTRQCQEIDLLMHVPFQADVDNPPLVSSGSSEETPFLMEPKSYSTTAFDSSRQDGGRQDFSCSKARDDDGNSSESTVPKTVLTKSSSMSYIKALKARRSTNSAAKKRAVVGSKRKRHEMEEGEQGNKDAVRRCGKVRIGRKTMKKMPLHKDNVDQSIYPTLDMLVDTEHEDKPLASPTKLERDKAASLASSPTVSSPSKLSPKKSGDSHVKLSIKSFMVPELLVDLPESATVANLKKAVMEAAMNLLGGGLCVRVLLQGKKVLDETESLLQAGISSGGKIESLGFMLEPNPMPTSTSVEDTFLVLSHGANQTTSRYPVLSKGSEINAGSLHVSSSEGLLEIDANSSGTEMQSTTVSASKEEILVHDSNGVVIPGPCALILHSSQTNNGSNGLAVVPFGQNPTSMGINKRRIRRPFSVAEVEVLVQAVEKLGTGRWRDVKLHAFPQAKHRTYVDLKDKWKTLVHTASIAPHQRRGEPVPQLLLDRVIQAHSYWTAQQAKQQSVETRVF